MLGAIGPTLVCTRHHRSRRSSVGELLDATHIDRLNLGPVPTTQINWLQPHEGNIVEFLFRARAFQAAEPLGATLVEAHAAVLMRILSITAGAAGMYCGSCTRDNALARELTALGHDVTLLPVYTPTRPDEPNVSRSPRALWWDQRLPAAVRADLSQNAPDVRSPLDSPRVIQALSSRAISTDARMLGSLTVSMLQGEQGALRREFDKLVDWIRAEPLPDVDQPAEHAADRARGAAEAGVQPAGLLHHAGRGVLS